MTKEQHEALIKRSLLILNKHKLSKHDQQTEASIVNTEIDVAWYHNKAKEE